MVFHVVSFPFISSGLHYGNGSATLMFLSSSFPQFILNLFFFSLPALLLRSLHSSPLFFPLTSHYRSFFPIFPKMPGIEKKPQLSGREWACSLKLWFIRTKGGMGSEGEGDSEVYSWMTLDCKPLQLPPPLAVLFLIASWAISGSLFFLNGRWGKSEYSEERVESSISVSVYGGGGGVFGPAEAVNKHSDS